MENNTVLPSATLEARIGIQTNREIQLINVEDIVRCKTEHFGHSTCVYLSDGREIISSKGIGVFEKMLNKYNFLRIHHSTIINVDLISKCQLGERLNVILKDGSIHLVSKRKKNALLNKIKKV